MRERNSESSLLKADGAKSDAAIGLVAVIAAFSLALFFDLAGAWLELSRTYAELHLDTLPVLALILAVVLAWYSFRRWRETKLTSAVRMRLNAHMEVLLSREAMRTQQLTQIKAMEDSLLAADDSRQACKLAVTHLRRIFPFGSGAFFLVRKGLDNLAAVGGWGIFSESQPSDLAVCHCLAMAPGMYRSERGLGGQADCGGCALDGAEGVLCVPVSAGGKTFGMLQLVYGGSFGKLPSALKNRLEFDHMSKLAENVCRSIAQHLANIGLRRKLAEESARDPLTGLLNRRGLEQLRNGAVAGIMESGDPLAVMVMDVDQFKAINDSFGHDVGDSVLAFVGRTIADQCRSGDITCRLGGDEFLIALPTAGAQTARAKGEAIRNAVADLGPLRTDHPALNVTLSVGLAVLPNDGADWDDVAAAADAALYAAKRQGRNRIAEGPGRP